MINQGTHDTFFDVIAGLTRDLPSEKDLSPRSGDGVPLLRNDGSSAMTVKG